MINQDCYLVKMAVKLSEYDQEIKTKCKQKILKTQWVTTVIAYKLYDKIYIDLI